MNSAMERTRRTVNLLLAFACVAGGAAICVWLVKTNPAPPRRGSHERVLEVSVLEVQRTVEATPIVGHGTVRAKHQVKIVPQVSGKLIYANEQLAPGKIIPEGDLLFEIDPTVYEARVRQAEAEIHRLEASLERSDQEMANLDQRIANVEQMLSIDEKDYLTSKRLYEVENVGTQRGVDLLYQKLLRQKDVSIGLKSNRAVVPHIKLETQAQLDAARARLRQMKHDLESAKIYCPFEARVELVTAYGSQVVTAHFSIATLTDMSAFELPVAIDPRELRWLAEAIRPEALRKSEVASGPEVSVCWSLHGQEFVWRGAVSRFERVDEATRMAWLIVEIRGVDMLGSVQIGSNESRPTLTMGMHCRAELPAQALSGALVIPRHTIHDNRWVYVFEPDPQGADARMGRLGRRMVPMLRSFGGAVLVDYDKREGTEVCGLRPGERVVVSPLIKPVVGMKVRLRDEKVAGLAPYPPVDPFTAFRLAQVLPEPKGGALLGGG